MSSEREDVTIDGEGAGDGGNLKVLIVTHYGELYGANRSMLDLIDGTVGRVSPYVVMPRKGRLVEALRVRSVEHTVIPFRPWYYEKSSHSLLDASRKCRGWLAHHVVNQMRERVAGSLPRPFDLVYTNSSMTDFGARLAHRLNLPHVWHLREFGGPDYGIDFVTGFRHATRKIKGAEAVVANSDAVRSYFFGDQPGIMVIPNGVVRSSSFEAAGRSYPRRFVFLVAGVVQEQKGQREAVRALALLREQGQEANMIIAGDGATDELIRLARSVGVDDLVELLGFVPDLRPVFERSDVLLMCSHREAFGRVTVEAMAHGLPVIGRASGGTVEIIDDERTGLLYDGGATELAGAMSRLIEERELYERLSIRALEKARREFSLELYASRLLDVFEAVAELGERDHD